MTSWLERRERGWLDRVPKRTRAPQPVPPEEPKSAEPDPYGVVYTPLRCPKCQSKNVKTYMSRPPTRYHKCLDCSWNFKSTEKDP